MKQILKEIGIMRRELRELKIQNGQERRVIEDLRRIGELAVPDLPSPVPEPASAVGATRSG